MARIAYVFPGDGTAPSLQEFLCPFGSPATVRMPLSMSFATDRPCHGRRRIF